MERGELGTDSYQLTVVVFEGLIASLERPVLEKQIQRLRKWEMALDCWAFDYKVLDVIARYMLVNDLPVRVVTWRSSAFAQVLHDRLWELQCPVTETVATVYSRISPLYATDENITLVYDADPDHRFGYGFKVRDYTGAM